MWYTNLAAKKPKGANDGKSDADSLKGFSVSKEDLEQQEEQAEKQQKHQLLRALMGTGWLAKWLVQNL